ncbi:MAG: hypothetical protein V1824_00255 [archaeon]
MKNNSILFLGIGLVLGLIIGFLIASFTGFGMAGKAINLTRGKDASLVFFDASAISPSINKTNGKLQIDIKDATKLNTSQINLIEQINTGKTNGTLSYQNGNGGQPAMLIWSGVYQYVQKAPEQETPE